MALHYASYKGDVYVVEVLLNHGADINVVTKEISVSVFYIVVCNFFGFAHECL